MSNPLGDLIFKQAGGFLKAGINNMSEDTTKVDFSVTEAQEMLQAFEDAALKLKEYIASKLPTHSDDPTGYPV